jgi:type II secretory pathway pseudopilin PulG
MNSDDPVTTGPDVSSGEQGYTMAALIMAIAVMAIMMGTAVQSVSFQAQREREAELIFRGEQYVEAIRLYKTRYGRFPMRIKEIWEADPKVIRRPFKDPITNSENWGIVFLGQENAGGLGGGGLGGGRGGVGPTDAPSPCQRQPRPWASDPGAAGNPGRGTPDCPRA